MEVAACSEAAPPVNLTRVLNAFSLQPGPVAPGEIIALNVPGFTPDQPVDVGVYPSAPLTLTGTPSAQAQNKVTW